MSIQDESQMAASSSQSIIEQNEQKPMSVSYASVAGAVKTDTVPLSDRELVEQQRKPMKVTLTSESDSELALKIQESLGLPAVTQLLDVMDKTKAANGNILVIVSPKRGVDLRTYGVYRLVFDLGTGRVVCRFMPSVAEMVTDDITVTEDGKIPFTYSLFSPEGGKTKEVTLHPSKDVVWYREQTGPQMILFRYAGQDFYVTPKSFNGRIGQTPMIDLYRQMKGPSHDQLFSTDETFSPIIHTFMIVTKETAFATKEPFTHGRIVYFNWSRMEWSTNPPADYAWSDNQSGVVRIPSLWNPTISEPTPTGPVTVSQSPIPSIEEAREFLRHGYSIPYTKNSKFPIPYYEHSKWWYEAGRNPRASAGESLIAYLLDSEGNVVSMWKIRSKAFHDREQKRMMTINVGMNIRRPKIEEDLSRMWLVSNNLGGFQNESRGIRWSSFFPTYQINDIGPLSAVYTHGRFGQSDAFDFFACLKNLQTFIRQNGYIIVWPQTKRQNFMTKTASGELVVDTRYWNRAQIFYSLIIAELMFVPAVHQFDVLNAAVQWLKDIRELVNFVRYHAMNGNFSSENNVLSLLVENVKQEYDMILDKQPIHLDPQVSDEIRAAASKHLLAVMVGKTYNKLYGLTSPQLLGCIREVKNSEPIDIVKSGPSRVTTLGQFIVETPSI